MENFEDDKEKLILYYVVLDLVLSIGNVILFVGGEGFEVVMVVVNYFENNFLFNVGKGVICISVGIFELDVFIMEGKDLIVGVVVGLKMVKNLINVVYVVKIKIFYVMLVGEGVDWFVKL